MNVPYLAASTKVTKIKLEQKQAEGIAEARSGQRGPGSVWGSGLAAAACASLSLTTGLPELWQASGACGRDVEGIPCSRVVTMRLYKIDRKEIRSTVLCTGSCICDAELASRFIYRWSDGWHYHVVVSWNRDKQSPFHHPPPPGQVGFVASICSKLSDTVSSEVGKAYGKTTYLVTTFERVPRGTEGAVSDR